MTGKDVFLEQRDVFDYSKADIQKFFTSINVNFLCFFNTINNLSIPMFSINSFLHTGVLLDRLGGDGSGGFGGVVLLHIRCGGGDGAPCFAAGHP